MKTRLHVLVALLCPVLLAACSSGDSASGGAHDAKAPFGPTTRTAIHRVKQTNSDGSTVLLEGRVKGDVTTTSGETLTQYVMVDPNDSTVPEKEIWANPIPLDSSGTVKLGLFDDHESVRLVADPPASFNFSSPVGSKQTVTGDVTRDFPWDECRDHRHRFGGVYDGVDERIGAFVPRSGSELFAREWYRCPYGRQHSGELGEYGFYG